MRNLILLIWKNHLFLIFLLLELICAILIIQNNNFHKSSFINSTNSISSSIYEARSNMTDYFSLRDTYGKLAEENAELRAMVPTDGTIYGLNAYRINDSIYRQQYEYLPARVINNSTNRKKNYLTLNIGKNQGIENAMGVIGPQGLVGQVKDVSDNYASVLSVLHTKTKIRVKSKKTGDPGWLIWEGDDPQYATVKDVSGHVKIDTGDTFITSGASAIFPEGIVVGTVSGIGQEAGENFYIIKIKLATSFNNVSVVYVVKNLLKEEQLKLEEETREDENEE